MFPSPVTRGQVCSWRAANTCAGFPNVTNLLNWRYVLTYWDAVTVFSILTTACKTWENKCAFSKRSWETCIKNKPKRWSKCYNGQRKESFWEVKQLERPLDKENKMLKNKLSQTDCPSQSPPPHPNPTPPPKASVTCVSDHWVQVYEWLMTRWHS